jgi:rhodanese-related sulfurtransferase
MQEYIDFFSNNLILTIAWIVLAAMVVNSFLKDKLTGVKSVNTQEATFLINKQNAIVVDIRSQDEYKKGHIVNAKNIPLSQIEQGNLAGIESHKETPIILVCDSGARTSGAATKLVKAGFTQVHNLLAGMGGWQSANLPTTKR